LRHSNLVPDLQPQQQQQSGGAAAAAPSADAAAEGQPAQDVGGAAAESGPAAGLPAASPPQQQQQQRQQPAAGSREVSQAELAAEASGDWRVLFHEGQLDCQLSLEDPSPGMPWGRARFQASSRRCLAGRGCSLHTSSQCAVR
jgi:uncharacterized iron-regulated membrane protein